MKKLYALLAALTFTVACGGGTELTGPSGGDLTTSGGTPTAASVTPAPSPSPSPNTSTPVGDRPYVEFYPPAGAGKFCNPMTHSLTLTVEYWNANDFQKQILLETQQFTAAAGTCVSIPPAREMVKIDCGKTVHLQVDAATTEHLGHIFVDVVGEACQPPCVEEWKELTPEITYSEWSECSKPSAADIFDGCVETKCYQTRTKTTVVKEQNTCTKVVREKSRKEEQERRECPCKVENTCENTPASSTAANPFELDNSGDATELAWVNENVKVGPWKQIAKPDYRKTCEYADYDAKVVLVKSADKWGYILNVKKGDKLCSFAKNKKGDLQDISHITYYNCK